MDKKLDINTCDRVEIQTVGALIRTRSFLHALGITVVSDTLILVMTLGNYWPTLCHKLDTALFGIIGSLYTMSIGSTAFTVSLILVDDCSWLFKSSVLFCSSVTLLVSSLYLFYEHFQHCDIKPLGLKGEEDIAFRNMLSMAYPVNVTELPDTVKALANTKYPIHTYMYQCYDSVNFPDAVVWTPIIVSICIGLGVIYLLFALYLFVSLDDN